MFAGTVAKVTGIATVKLAVAVKGLLIVAESVAPEITWFAPGDQLTNAYPGLGTAVRTCVLPKGSGIVPVTVEPPTCITPGTPPQAMGPQTPLTIVVSALVAVKFAT
jgi:hypothetical protein